MARGTNEPLLMSMIMDELKQHGEDLREHSRKADESSRELQRQVGEIRENQKGVETQVDSINQQLGEIKTTLRPIANQVAVNSNNIDALEKDKDAIFSHITNLKDTVRGGSFWESPNARYVILAGLILLVGLFGLAGYNISLKDLPL